MFPLGTQLLVVAASKSNCVSEDVTNSLLDEHSKNQSNAWDAWQWRKRKWLFMMSYCKKNHWEAYPIPVWVGED